MSKMGGSWSRPFFRTRFTAYYLQTPSDLQASTSAVWKSDTLVGSATNTPKAVAILLFQDGFPTTSCVRLPTTLLLAQSLAAFCEYSLNLLGSQSVRAQIEPLSGLKASWPSFEAATVSQSMVPSGFLLPTGRTKLSARKTKMPWVPGGDVQSKASCGFRASPLGAGFAK